MNTDITHIPRPSTTFVTEGVPVSALYPLDAGSAEVTGVGFLAMTLTEADQKALIALAGGGSNRQAIAFADGASTGASQKMAFNTGAKAIEWAPTMPASAGGGAATAAWQLEMNMATAAFSNIVQVKLEQRADGTRAVQVYVGATLAYSTTPGSFPTRVGVALDANTSTARVYFNDSILTLSSSTYTPAEAIATIAVYEKTACPAGDAGALVGAQLYTEAGTFTGTTYQTGTTDIGGVVI